LFIYRVDIFKKRTMAGNKCVVNEEVSMDYRRTKQLAGVMDPMTDPKHPAS
jgi:hypothetical protein